MEICNEALMLLAYIFSHSFKSVCKARLKGRTYYSNAGCANSDQNQPSLCRGAKSLAS